MRKLFILCLLILCFVPSVFAVYGEYKAVFVNTVVGTDTASNLNGGLFQPNATITNLTVNATAYGIAGTTVCEIWNFTTSAAVPTLVSRIGMASLAANQQGCQWNASVILKQNDLYVIIAGRNNTAGYNNVDVNTSATYPITSPFGSFINGTYRSNGLPALNSATRAEGFGNITASILSVAPPPGTNVSFTAWNFYTNSSITNFTVNISGTYWNTTNGTVITNILSNSTQLWTVQLLSNESGGYFNRTETGFNVSSATFNLSMIQSVYVFVGSQFLTGATVPGVNFSASNGTQTHINVTHYFAADDYNVTAFATGFANRTVPLTVSALSNTTYNVTNMTNAFINITATYAGFATSVLAFNVTLNYTAYNVTETYSTTNGTLVIYSINNTPVNITISGDSFFTNSTNITTASANAYYNNVTFSVYSSLSLFFRFLDEETLVPVLNVTYLVMSGANSGTYVTTNGQANLTLLPDADYEIRYGVNSSVYYPRSYYFRIPLNSVELANQTFLMINQSISSVFQRTVINSTSLPLVNYTLVVLRAYPTSGNNSFIYRVAAMDHTDNNGNAVFYAIPNSQAYSYLLYDNFTLVYTFKPEFLTSSTGTLIAADPFNTLKGFNVVNNIASTLVYDNTSQSFVATYSDAQTLVQSMCLYVRYTQGRIANVTSSCSTATSGTITEYYQNNLTGTYYAYLMATYSNMTMQINQVEYRYNPTGLPTQTRALIGWAIFGLCVLVGMTIGAFINPTFGIILIVVSMGVLGTTLIGFFLMTWLVFGAVLVASGLTLYLWRPT